jgi:hypothetical protein
LSGEAFEDYVTSVLKRLHSDFTNPAPMGRLGDGGCDGLAENGSILYAIYGSRATTKIDEKLSRKLESDFRRGLGQWPTFITWRFVTNTPFGPTATRALTDLRVAHQAGTARPLTLDLWLAPDDLWRLVVAKLPRDQLDEILPGVPDAQDVELTDLVALIEALEDQDADRPIDGGEAIRPVPGTKMDFNRIPDKTRIEFNEGRQSARRIDRWFGEQADPGLRDSKARRFRAIYDRLRRQPGLEPEEIVERVYVALGGSDFRLSRRRANAVYAVTAYFFDSCDIFEEPTVDTEGVPDAVTD